MNIGIIAEYNPLHNGHLYLYKEIKKLYSDSLITVILSSEFTQRGDLAVFNKFDRTNLALQMGANLVLSNPVLTSMQNASLFAYYNIYYLNLLKVDSIAFGSEEATLDLFETYEKESKTKEFKSYLDEGLESGKSFKSSYLNAFSRLGLNNLKSNDLLGFFYFKAIKEINPNIKIIMIKRKDSNYVDDYIENTNIQSASYLRNSNEISYFVPKYTNDLFIKKGYRNKELLFTPLLTSILNNNNLDTLLESSEGLNNKLKEIYKFTSLHTFTSSLVSKRYSVSKIQRLIVDALFNINMKPKNPDFIRVTGADNLGLSYLNKIKKDVKIYTNIKEGLNDILDLEIKISKILGIIYKDDLLKLEQQGPILKK